jgi:hypothetical protein
MLGNKSLKHIRGYRYLGDRERDLEKRNKISEDFFFVVACVRLIRGSPTIRVKPLPPCYVTVLRRNGNGLWLYEPGRVL